MSAISMDKLINGLEIKLGIPNNWVSQTTRSTLGDLIGLEII